MPEQLHLQPAPGLVVRDPITLQPLAAEGEHKPASTFWLRRLADGDVRQVDAGFVIATVDFATGRVLEDADTPASNPVSTTPSSPLETRSTRT